MGPGIFGYNPRAYLHDWPKMSFGLKELPVALAVKKLAIFKIGFIRLAVKT